MSTFPKNYSDTQQRAIIDAGRQARAALRSKARTSILRRFAKYLTLRPDELAEAAGRHADAADALLAARHGHASDLAGHTFDLDKIVEVIQVARRRLHRGLVCLELRRDPRFERAKRALTVNDSGVPTTRRAAADEAARILRALVSVGLTTEDLGLSSDAFDDLRKAAATFPAESDEQHVSMADATEVTEALHVELEAAYQALALLEHGVDTIEEEEPGKPVRALRFVALRTAFHRRRATDTDEAPVFEDDDEDGLPPLDVVG